MKKQHYVGIDIGASSGRVMLAEKTAEDRIQLEEVHRFDNAFVTKNKTDYWQIDLLIKEVLTGLEKVKKKGVKECFVGMDTWAVDYCLLDEKGALLREPISYRDTRTKNAVEEFSKQMCLETLFQKTGIQIQPFNTLFQLFKEEDLSQVSTLLLIPDYLGYVFTGRQVMEETNASTTQLFHAQTRQLEKELLAILDISEDLFPERVVAGTILGELQREKFADYDLPQATFIVVASHDTASAMLATPAQGAHWATLSSGTWSLIGCEWHDQAITSEQAFTANFTNEWGINNSFRFLKNIMGLWLIQNVAREENFQHSYAELAALAEKETAFQQIFPVNDTRFLNPCNMTKEIQNFYKEMNQKIPETPGELARCIFDSLAHSYAEQLQQLQKITGKRFDTLHIVGGGANNALLNQLTSDTCQIHVLAGPSEATVIGNIVVQLLATKELTSLEQAREVIRKSFSCTHYYPKNTEMEKKYDHSRKI